MILWGVAWLVVFALLVATVTLQALSLASQGAPSVPPLRPYTPAVPAVFAPAAVPAVLAPARKHTNTPGLALSNVNAPNVVRGPLAATTGRPNATAPTTLAAVSTGAPVASAPAPAGPGGFPTANAALALAWLQDPTTISVLIIVSDSCGHCTTMKNALSGILTPSKGLYGHRAALLPATELGKLGGQLGAVSGVPHTVKVGHGKVHGSLSGAVPMPKLHAFVQQQ